MKKRFRIQGKVRRRVILYYVTAGLLLAASILFWVTEKAPTFAPTSITPSDPVQPARHPLTVVDVRDGDTVTLADGRSVRYLGINTSEMGEALSKEARAANWEMVYGKVVRLELDKQQTDSYGRTLAFVWVNGTNVNLELVRRGLAHLFFIPPNDKHYGEFLAAQREAQSRKRGIWALEEFQTPVRITTFRPDRGYLRMVSLAPDTLHLAGWTARNDRGHTFVFPPVSLKPGFSLILNFGEGEDQQDAEKISLHWGLRAKEWHWNRPSVFIEDTSGRQVAFKSATR